MPRTLPLLTLAAILLCAHADTHAQKAARAGAARERQIAARPPWAWFDRNERDRPRGEWFFDPAATARRHLGCGADFSNAYLHAPFLSLFRR